MMLSYQRDRDFDVLEVSVRTLRQIATLHATPNLPITLEGRLKGAETYMAGVVEAALDAALCRPVREVKEPANG
jgi:hypothetical protein